MCIYMARQGNLVPNALSTKNGKCRTKAIHTIYLYIYICIYILLGYIYIYIYIYICVAMSIVSSH